jgi:hypothetical protein
MENLDTPFTATVTLNIAQMVEIENALRARIVTLYGLDDPGVDPENENLRWRNIALCQEVLRLLEPVVDRGVEAFEEETTRAETQILDDPEAVKKFLEG